MNDGMVGEYKLPDGWFFMCAGNRLKDKAGTNRIPTHIKDRVTFIYVEPDIDDFCDLATKRGWSPYIPLSCGSKVRKTLPYFATLTLRRTQPLHLEHGKEQTPY